MIAWGTILLASIYLFVQGILGQRNEEVREKQGAQIQSLQNSLKELETKLEAARMKAETPDTLPGRPELVDAEIVNFLGLLQRKGRFIDFLMDDITRYDDKQVGAAARIVHQGCSQVIREHFDIAPVRGDAEGTRVTLEKNYNAAQNRLVGRVVGQPPFKGIVLHRGWKTGKVTLPRVSGEGERCANHRAGGD